MKIPRFIRGKCDNIYFSLEQYKWKYCIYFTFYQKQLIFILMKISLPKLQGCKTIHHMPFYDKRLRRSCFDRLILNCPNCIKGSIPDWPELYTICEKYFNAPLVETLSFIPGTVLVKSWEKSWEKLFVILKLCSQGQSLKQPPVRQCFS